MSAGWMPIFFGSRAAHSSQTVCTTASPRPRRRKKKSRSVALSTGSSPWLMACAFMTMRLLCACRKISVSRTVITMPLRIRSENRFPAPTAGSWSGSPTSSSRASRGSARSSDAMSCRSTIDASSTIIASSFSGSSSSWKNDIAPVSGSNCASSSRWMVEASRPVTSESRFAARPVGAASCVLSPIASKRSKMPVITVVFPVPGPPVTSSRRHSAASAIACFCCCA